MMNTTYTSTATPRPILRELGATEFDSGNDDTPRWWVAGTDGEFTHGYLIQAFDDENGSVWAGLDHPITGYFTVTQIEATEGADHDDQPNPNHVQDAIRRAERGEGAVAA